MSISCSPAAAYVSSPSSSRGRCGGVANIIKDDYDEDNANNYIEHQVSNMDTLAGVAIKYGVEVADIKKMNALVSDLQMFALNSLRIPLPGRHPPSSPNDPTTPGRRRLEGSTSLRQSQSAESFHSLSRSKSIQPRGFYGVKTSIHITELLENGHHNHHLHHHRKSRSLVSELLPELTEDVLLVRDNNEVDKPVRRRQKADSAADFGPKTPAKTGKPISVRKSCSTSNLQEQEQQDSSNSILPALMWSLKPDLNAFSAARPIFDGLPKPITSRKNKAAID